MSASVVIVNNYNENLNIISKECSTTRIHRHDIIIVIESHVTLTIGDGGIGVGTVGSCTSAR